MHEFKNFRREIALGASQNLRSAGRAPSMFCRIDPMFTIEDRSLIRSKILEKAASDRRIVGAAITGSGATGAEDQCQTLILRLVSLRVLNDCRYCRSGRRTCTRSSRRFTILMYRVGHGSIAYFCFPELFKLISLSSKPLSS